MPFPADIDVAAPTRVDRLKVAYAVHVALKVMEADGVVDAAEIEILALTFSNKLLRGCGFLDAEGHLNRDWEGRLTEAAALLPIELSSEEKLELLTLLHRIQISDGEKHPKEHSVVQATAGHLGVTRGEFAAHLKKLGM